MVKQYPHYLFVRIVSESVQDSDGNWTSSNESWNLHSECREETNGKGNIINGTDGKAIVFSSVIYLPKSTPKIIEGSEVMIGSIDSNENDVRIKGTVLKFSEGQLSCRLWV